MGRVSDLWLQRQDDLMYEVECERDHLKETIRKAIVFLEDYNLNATGKSNGEIPEIDEIILLLRDVVETKGT